MTIFWALDIKRRRERKWGLYIFRNKKEITRDETISEKNKNEEGTADIFFLLKVDSGLHLLSAYLNFFYFTDSNLRVEYEYEYESQVFTY
jgi:hypothetical protein